MKVHHTLICLFLSLQDGNTGLTDAQQLYTGTEGGNITVPCSFSFHGEKKLFCRNKCEGDDSSKLIETEKDEYQSSRYRIKYDRGGWTEKAILNVSITHLIKSDSGRYMCGLTGRFISDGYEDFELRVTDAPTPPGPNLTPTPLSTSLPPASTTAASPQTVGGSAPSSASVTTAQPEMSPAGRALQLYIGLVLAFMVTLLSAAMLLLCRNRSSKHTERPSEMVYTGVMKENTVYEDVREDGRSRAPPAEVALYTTVTHTKPTPVEASDNDSPVTAAAAVAPDNAEDVTYSNVNMVASLRKTSTDRTDTAVIYSVPALAGQSSSHHDASDLYSTVAPR